MTVKISPDGLEVSGFPLVVNILILLGFGVACITGYVVIKKRVEKEKPLLKSVLAIIVLLIAGFVFAWIGLWAANKKLSENIEIAKNNSANEVKVPPSRPENLYASPTSDSQINLTWEDKSNSENGFYLERKLGDNGAYIQIASIPSNITSYSDTGLAPGTKGFYRVQAYNTEGKSEFSNERVAVTPSPVKQDWSNPWAVLIYVILPIMLAVVLLSVFWTLFWLKVRGYKQHIKFLEEELFTKR